MITIFQVKQEVEKAFQVELKEADTKNRLYKHSEETDDVSNDLYVHEFAGIVSVSYQIHHRKSNSWFECSERITYLGRVEAFKDKVNALKELAAKYL